MLFAIYRISMALFGEFAAKCNFMEINSKHGDRDEKSTSIAIINFKAI